MKKRHATLQPSAASKMNPARPEAPHRKGDDPIYFPDHPLL